MLLSLVVGVSMEWAKTHLICGLQVKKKGICQKQPAARQHRTSPGAVSMPLRGSATSNPRSDPAPEQGQAAAAHLRQGCSDVSRVKQSRARLADVMEK